MKDPAASGSYAHGHGSYGRAARSDYRPSILKLLPLIPTSSTGLTSSSATAPVDIDQWTWISHNFSAKTITAAMPQKIFVASRPCKTTIFRLQPRQSCRQIFTLNETHFFKGRERSSLGFNRSAFFSAPGETQSLVFDIQDGVTEPIGLRK